MEMWHMSLEIMPKILLIRNMVSKNVNLLCFTTVFFKQLKNAITHQKCYKIVTENVF